MADALQDKLTETLKKLQIDADDMSEKNLLKMQTAYENEIRRNIILRIVDIGLIYGLTGLSYWYLSTITYFLIAYIYSVSLMFGYVLFQYSNIRKERKKDYQSLLAMCEIPKSKHDRS